MSWSTWPRFKTSIQVLALKIKSDLSYRGFLGHIYLYFELEACAFGCLSQVMFCQFE